MRPGSYTWLPHDCLRPSMAFFLFFILWRCRFFRVFFVPLPFSLGTESTSYVFSFRMVFFYLLSKSSPCSQGRTFCQNPARVYKVEKHHPAGKNVRPQGIRYQRRRVDDCSPGRGGMAQDGGTRCGTFHGETDRCRESQGWTTACSSMPERHGKDQGEDSPKQACSYWLPRHS